MRALVGEGVLTVRAKLCIVSIRCPERLLMADIVEKLQNQEVTKNRSNDVLSEDWHSTPRQSRHIGG